jgi:large subunit ribosomal protein L10
MVADYVAQLSRSQAVFLTDYRGLTVAGLQVLRAKIREVHGGHAVVKNTLAVRALQQAGLPVPTQLLSGPVALSFAYSEAPALARLLTDFAKETKIMQVKGGIMEGRILNAAQVAALADMPPREVILAQLLGLIRQPGNQVAGVINAAGSKLAATIKAYADKLQSSEATV